MSTLHLQRLLKHVGHDPGPLDGLWGRRTAAAYEAAMADPIGVATAAVGLDEEDENTRLLIAELERDEGRVLHAYKDSLGYLTIGIGRLIDERRGGGISHEEADLLKRNDIIKVRAQLDDRLPWWRGLDPVRQRAIQNMAFQLGIGGLTGFRNTLAAIEAGDYDRAAANMRQSKWARQTPARAERVIRMIETGAA